MIKLIKKIINLENPINELKNSLIDCEQDKICLSDLRSENEKLLCEIDDIKIKIQKYLEESNISKKKFEAIKSVNIELQNNVEKLQKDLDEKQKILESLTQGKENLNVILGSKINVNKEGLGYVPKIKKKYDVIIINFVSQQKIEINLLIKINYTISENNDKNLFTVDNGKEKRKEKIEKNKNNKVKIETN